MRVRGLLILLTGCIGLYINNANIGLNYHMQTVFLAVPALYAGYAAKLSRERLEKYVTWYGTILAAVLLYGVLSLDIGMIELAKNSIIHPLLFYPVTAVGIYLRRAREGHGPQPAVYLYRKEQLPYHGPSFYSDQAGGHPLRRMDSCGYGSHRNLSLRFWHMARILRGRRLSASAGCRGSKVVPSGRASGIVAK